MLVCRGASVSNRLSSIYSIEGKLRSNVMGKCSARSVFFFFGSVRADKYICDKPADGKKWLLQIQYWYHKRLSRRRRPSAITVQLSNEYDPTHSPVRM